MKKKYVKQLIDLGFLESNEICTLFGQEVLDNFLYLFIDVLIKNGYKHYNKDFIKEGINGKFYRINSHYLDVYSNVNNINNEALDIEHLFSRYFKEFLGIALIEGYRYRGIYKYYYAYIYLNDLESFFEIKQNKNQTYVRFDIYNIFYSIIEENNCLSYLLSPKVVIIPLHQNKSGVLSYATKIREKMEIDSYIDDGDCSPYEKTKKANNLRIPLKIYAGPKEFKHQKVIIEYNDRKEEISFNDLDKISDYLTLTLKNKYNNNLRKIYSFEKEKKEINNLGNLDKVNICNECNIDGYKKFLIPFNRVSKTHKCIICQKEKNNIIYIKRA